MTTLERRIYIGGLDENITEDILYSVFITFGKFSMTKTEKNRGN